MTNTTELEPVDALPPSLPPPLEELEDGELQRCEDELRDIALGEARLLWQRGVLYNRVRDRGLYRQAGFSGFAPWVEARGLYSRAHVYRAMRIAREFSARVAERYGTAKLEAILRYLSATPADEKPGDVFAIDIRLRLENGRFLKKPITEATPAEIDQATRLMEESRRGGTRVPRDATRKVERLAEALPGVGAGRASLKRHKNGSLVVSFRDIPFDDIEAFLAAVRAHLGT